VGVSLIPAYLGRPAPLVQQAVRYIGWAVCPLALYFAFRGLLDGASDHPINLKNLIASLLVTAVAGSALMLRHADMEAFALLFVASSFLLGALSVVSSNRQLRDSRTWLVEEPSI
jgi:hypothetical protein